MATRVLVVLGSARKTGNIERVGAWLERSIASDERFELDLLHAADLDLPFFDEPVSPNWNQGVYQNPKGAAWAAQVGKADAVILVTPEYNHSFSALIKNVIDWVGPEWKQKPAAIVTYSVSPFGGIRAAEHMRNVLAEVQTNTVKDTLAVPFVEQAIADDGTAISEHLAGQIGALLDAFVQNH